MNYQIKKVVQRDPTGCGLACVASIANTSYESVKRIACHTFNWHERGVFYTYASHLAKLLAQYGCGAGQARAVRRWESLPVLAIIAVNPDKTNFRWHWVVYVRNADEEYVVDPRSKRVRRRDFARMRLRSYIPISRIYGAEDA
jgi:ABC-type bacteriocin/lantibiotic exporter with double-glycine peptidase domain